MTLINRINTSMKNQLLHPENKILLLLPLLLFIGMVAIEAASTHPYSHQFKEIVNQADTSEPEMTDVFKIVEEMPRFPGCEDKELSDFEKKQCFKRKLLEFVYNEIKYPEEAIKNDVSGMVVVQFIVEPDGSVSHVKAVRDIGAGCGAEAVRVVELMNERGIQWIPGKQRGRKVRVQYNLPVKFELKDDETQAKPDFEKIDEEKKDPDHVFQEVEELACLKECADKFSSPDERKNCTKESITKAKTKYNDFFESPRKEDLKGISVVEFIIEKDGSASNYKVIRPLCEECDKEALRQVRLMNKNDLDWIPGKIDGKPVRSIYLIAIPFKK